MGTKGTKVQQIQMDHNVDIKFPERNDDPEVRFTCLIFVLYPLGHSELTCMASIVVCFRDE